MMKPAGLLLALLLVTGPAAIRAGEPVAPPAPAAPDRLSPEVTRELTEKLPKYAPPAPAKPQVAPDPDVLELPKVTVTQKKRPRLTDGVMMTSKAFDEKLAKEKFSAFDHSFLNKSGFLGPYSAAARAREEYDRDQKEQFMSEIRTITRAAEQIDPAEAKALREAASRP